MGNSVGDMGLLSVDRDMDSLVDRGGVRGDHSLGRVHVVGGVVNVGSLNNLLDRVNLVRGRDGDSPGHGNLVRPGDMLVHNDLTLHRDGDMDRDIDIVVLDIDLGDDVGLLGSDPGVGPHGSEDLLLDHSVSGSRSLVGGSGRDGSNIGSSVWDDGRWEGACLHNVLGRASNAVYSGLGDGLLSSNSVLVSSNSVLNTLLNNRGSSSVCVVGLSYNSRGRGHRGSMGHSGASSVSTGGGNSRTMANHGLASGVCVAKADSG